jgi:hypothetical protein
VHLLDRLEEFAIDVQVGFSDAAEALEEGPVGLDVRDHKAPHRSVLLVCALDVHAQTASRFRVLLGAPIEDPGDVAGVLAWHHGKQYCDFLHVLPPLAPDDRRVTGQASVLPASGAEGPLSRHPPLQSRYSQRKYRTATNPNTSA